MREIVPKAKPVVIPEPAKLKAPPKPAEFNFDVMGKRFESFLLRYRVAISKKDRARAPEAANFTFIAEFDDAK